MTLLHPPGLADGAILAGIDEVGRGPLAGPVVAAVVTLRSGQQIEGVRDSKQLTPERREFIAVRIRIEAVEFAIGLATQAEIDALNILKATLLAMRRAVAQLNVAPALIEVDGNRAPELDARFPVARTVIGGDRLRPAIAAASVLAKVHRDALMRDLHERYPDYGFDRHKGYPTAEHQAVLRRLGPCPEHRRSFAPVRAATLAGVS